jgi:glycosyltransferase involved in cell wall biosynthesis
MDSQNIRIRIAIVVQRYGLEVNGGAELHARQLAHALAQHYQVEVLTSTALDHHTWNPHYPVGTEMVAEIPVRRFLTVPRDRSKRYRLPIPAKLRFLLRNWLQHIYKPLVYAATPNDFSTFALWLRAQNFLQTHGQNYTAIIFFTALYYPAAHCLSVKPERSILVPTLHDEKAMYRPAFHRVFRTPKYIMYNTPAEERLAFKLYGNDISKGLVCGAGVEVKQITTDSVTNVLEKFQLQNNKFLLYVGRVDTAKGCDVLLKYFNKLKDVPLKLVFVGKSALPIQSSEKIVLTGFVNEEEKNALISTANALVVPSKYESLSLVLLESLALGTPVLVNADCEVLRDHIDASRAGFVYKGFAEFKTCVQNLLNLSYEQRLHMKISGQTYVSDHYTWPTVVEKFKKVIEQIHTENQHQSFN